MMMEDIDFVVLWVDDADKKWQEDKAKYQYLVTGKKVDASANRYRDWGIMPYWFRAVEKFAPWVHKVHFITCGQRPEWLNTNCPKLNCVDHKDYIPEDCLPVFNANPIEIGLHRIKGITDKFVFFNDDMFLLRPVSPRLFFKGGKPVHYAALHPLVPQGTHANAVMIHLIANSMSIINEHFDSRKQIKKNSLKWFSPFRAGLKTAFLNYLYSKHSAFIGFGNAHLPVPMLKETVETLWEKEPDVLLETLHSRFRTITDVTQYLFRYWDLASGNFYPTSLKSLGRAYNLSVESPVFAAIRTQKHNMVCLHDVDEECSDDVYQRICGELRRSFEEILPCKSKFEI